jgi:hypothetical protein
VCRCSDGVADPVPVCVADRCADGIPDDVADPVSDDAADPVPNCIAANGRAELIDTGPKAEIWIYSERLLGAIQ